MTEQYRPSGPRQLSRLARFATCEALRRAYRWKRSNVGLKHRLEQLREALGPLPRSGIGLRLEELDPALAKRVAALRETGRELIIADFDQDGGIAPRFGAIAGIPTISEKDFLPRSGCAVALVDLDGRVGVRKRFGSATGRFVQELEALLELGESARPVPRIMNVDWTSRSVTMTFIRGHVVRELLASAGAPIRDRDDPRPYSRSVDKERIVAGKAFLPKVLSNRQIEQIARALEAIHEAGFVLEDVKFGNIIIEHGSGEPMFVDLERALPVRSLPRALADHLREVDLRKLREHFGSPSAEEGGGR